MDARAREGGKGLGRFALVWLVGGLYLLVVIFFLVFRGVSVRTPDGAFARADYPAEDVVPDPTEVPAVRGTRSAPVDLAKALQPTPAALARGRELYGQACAACHGPKGQGNGPSAAALAPPPRNFTRPGGWVNGTAVTEIFQTLTRGIEGTSMAAFDTYPPEDRFALAHYARSLGGFPHAEDTPAMVARLDEVYGLSRGVGEPNRIPVSRAMERMAAEYRAPGPLELPGDPAEGRAGELYRSAVADPARAAAALAASDGWRRDVAAFARTVVSGAPANGFSPSAAALGPGDWRLLRDSVARSLPEE